jgi:transposase InsO family protein
MNLSAVPVFAATRHPRNVRRLARPKIICDHDRSESSWLMMKGREGRVYCAVVLEVFSRRVVGLSIDSSPTASLVTNALGVTIHNRMPDAGTVIHSDHGTRPTVWVFIERAKPSGLLPSMGSIGDCYDNSLMEAFWARVQTELLDRKRWKTRRARQRTLRVRFPATPGFVNGSCRDSRGPLSGTLWSTLLTAQASIRKT